MKTIGTLFAVAALSSSAPGFAHADSDTDAAFIDVGHARRSRAL